MFNIDLNGAVDISNLDGLTAVQYAVNKTLFLDLVPLLTSPAGISAKIEGLAFGADVRQRGTTVHTLWIANDNDFLETVPDSNNKSDTKS